MHKNTGSPLNATAVGICADGDAPSAEFATELPVALPLR
jgi:hypothetical protein